MKPSIVVVGAILAAGASKRLGRPKQLLVVDKGETLLDRTIRIARACAKIDALAVILGAHRDQITIAADDDGGQVTRIDNPDFAEGMGSSVRKAAEWARATNADGLLLMVCDQARLSTSHLNALIDAFDEVGNHNVNVGSHYGGAIGVPAIFTRARFPELMKVEGDRGAKSLLKDARFVDWPDGLIDIDTEADVSGFGAKNPPYS